MELVEYTGVVLDCGMTGKKQNTPLAVYAAGQAGMHFCTIFQPFQAGTYIFSDSPPPVSQGFWRFWPLLQAGVLFVYTPHHCRTTPTPTLTSMQGCSALLHYSTPQYNFVGRVFDCFV